MRFKFITPLFILVAIKIAAQETIVEEPKTLENQFDKIYRTSTTYQTYKVISMNKYLELKKNVLDSVKATEKTIADKDELLASERANIVKLEKELNETKANLTASTEKENSISFIGLELNKTTYNLLVWTIIIALALALGLFIFKFTRSNVLTKKAQEKLLEVEQEFESHRKNSLEREQKLRRQLQDEINKQRNS